MLILYIKIQKAKTIFEGFKKNNKTKRRNRTLHCIVERPT